MFNLKREKVKKNIFLTLSIISAFAKYFKGISYPNPLARVEDVGLFLANVTFEPKCRNN